MVKIQTFGQNRDFGYNFRPNNFETLHEPTFSLNPTFVAADMFAPQDFSNTIDAHVEWDKAPAGSSLGDGYGWEPFKFSQCCSTLVIAPQI